MNPQERYELIQEAMQAFNPFYRENVQAVFAAYEIQGRDWFYAYLANGLEPESLTTAVLQQLAPYANPQKQSEWLREAAGKGVLQADGENSYCLTERGRAAVEAFFSGAHQAIAPLAPLPEDEMARLADLLARIIKASEAASEPALKRHMLICRSTDPGADAVPAVRIDQYLTDLLRLRQDASLAAWADRGVDGRTWNAFTAVAGEENVSAASLAERFANRHFGAEEYAASLGQLVDLGWVEGEDGAYRLTERGQKIHDEAVEATNRATFSGWRALSAEEEGEVDDLLGDLRNRLQEMAADEAAAANERSHELTGKLSTTIFQITRPVIEPLMEELDLAERGLGFGLIQAGYFDPDPISDAQVRCRFPYAAPGTWDSRLSQLAAQELLAAADHGDYRLTEKGRATLKRLLDTFRDSLAAVSIAVDLDELAELLGRIVEASLDAADPPGSWALSRCHNLAPGEDAAALAKIDQYLDDLNAFRDDAHLASFAAYEISGHGWELFSEIWKGEVNTAAEMAEKTAHRGHDQSAYGVALDDLAARGWVTFNDDGTARLTAAGSSVRENAEKQTDRYFFRPWLVLNRAEQEQLLQLLTAADEQLVQLAEPAPSLP